MAPWSDSKHELGAKVSDPYKFLLLNSTFSRYSQKIHWVRNGFEAPY